MSSQLKTLHADKSKGKSSERTQQAVDELEYLVTFNRSITQAMARTMQDLSEGVFICMANFTLARMDSYLEYLHAGVKQNTLTALCTAPIYLSHRKPDHFHPYVSNDKSYQPDQKSSIPAWRQIRVRQQGKKGRGKICERCFLCRSLEICKSCLKYSNCCHKSSCRGQTAPVWGKMGSPGGEFQGSNSTQRGLHLPLPVQIQLGQITNCHKQLCKPPQKPRLCGGPVSAGEQKCSRTGSKPNITRVLQLAIFGTQTQQTMETYLGPKHLEHLPKHRVVQNEDTRDNKNFPTGRGVGHLHRFQRRILPYTNSQSVQEVHAFPCPGSVLPVQAPTLWSVHSTHGAHSGGQTDQTDGLT